MGSDCRRKSGSTECAPTATRGPGMSAQPKIAVIGAGIGGLALAGFLERQGADTCPLPR